MSSVARIAIFSAMALGANAPFLVIPNIEVLSLCIFLSGLYLGFKNGTAVAVVAGLIHIFFNPGGPQPVIIIGIVQIAGFILFAMGGSVLRRSILNNDNILKNVLILAAAGFALTFWYDLTTNIVFAFIFGPFWAALIGGLIFGITHIISNALLFGAFGTVARKIWRRIEHYMPSSAR